MADLNTLRPEVRKALEVCDRDLPETWHSQTTQWGVIRAELLRLATIEADALIALDCEHDWQVEHERAEKAEAELLRLTDENKRMRGIIETLDIEGHRRAEKAEAELAALKARIFQGIVLDVDDLALGHAGLPSEWRGKRVRLVVED